MHDDMTNLPRLTALWTPAFTALTATFAHAQATVWYEYENTVSDHWFSLNIERIGDVTGDGVADMLLGDLFFTSVPSQFANGQVQVLSGADGTFAYEVLGPTPGSNFGISTSDLGDVSGDGVPDFVIGDPLAGGSDGRVSVHSGVDGSLLFGVDGDSGERLGYAVCGLGDVNGDGVPDFVATHPAGGLSGGGGDILSGADGSLLDSIGGGGFTADDYATSATNLGDVDGDGIADVALGAPGETANTGMVRAYSGATGANLYTLNGQGHDEFFGSQIQAIDDVDGDGANDLAVGAPGLFGVGQVRVYSGDSGAFLYDVTGSASPQSFGQSLARIGDLNGDGIEEFLIGDSAIHDLGQGTVHVISGLNGDTIQSIEGNLPDHYFGRSMCALDDVNGDGSLEFAMVAQGDLSKGTPARVMVFATGCTTESAPVCTSLPNTTGMVGTLSVAGCGNSTIGGTVELAASDLPIDQYGIMVMSQVPNNTPLGAGNLCVGLPIVRLQESGGVILNSGPTGTIVSHYDLESLPQMTQVLAGSTWRFQLYHRDTGPTGSNLTNSVDLTF
jgi:hypothetical protein